MSRRQFVMMILLAGLAACAAMPEREEGPGMILTFSNGIREKRLMFDDDKAITSSGKRFASPGSLGPDRNPPRGGATMGAAPDGSQLPEWVEFTWQEWPYPGQPAPRDPQAYQLWSKSVLDKARSIPKKTGRVYIRSRVPKDVIDEVIASNRQRLPNQLPEKSLWVYLIWTESGIKMRWELKKGSSVLRAGGDDIS